MPGLIEREPKAPRPVARYRSVLVPLDGSRDAERAIRPGEWLAERFGAELHVVAADVQRHERFWYAHYLDDMTARLPGVVTHCSDEPYVAKAIRRTADELSPCLVCLASHGRSRTAAIVGSTFAGIAATARAPLVVVGPQAGAQQLAAAPDLDDLAVDTTVILGSAGHHAELARHLAHRPADLVAAATHARTGVTRALRGSEVARIIRHCPAPVLVLPPSAPT